MSPKALYVVTGSCPQTEAEIRLEHADMLDEQGDHLAAEEYRLIVRRMHAEWDDRSERGRVKRALSKVQGPDPDELVESFGTMFWHEPNYRQNVVCSCGHFALFLCDEPIGDGQTCDLPACKCCRNQVGPDLDQCAFHASTRPRELLTPSQHG